MTNFDFKSMKELRDVESFNIDRMMKNLHIPAWLRWRWIRKSSRDNARTPMQWSAEPGAGFTTATPWIGINHNHQTINWEAEEADAQSVLQYYRRMIALRAGNETLKYGCFTPLHGDRRVMAYARALGEDRYVTVLNFSSRTARAAYSGDVVASNMDRTAYDGKLQPYEAVVLHQTQEGIR